MDDPRHPHPCAMDHGARAGGQSDASTDEEKLRLRCALKQAAHLAQVVQAHNDTDTNWPSDEIYTAEEDRPDAYRHTPMKSEEARGCVVALNAAKRSDLL